MSQTPLLSPFIQNCLEKNPQLKLEDNQFVQHADSVKFLRWLKQETQGLEEDDFLKCLRELRDNVFAKLAYLEITNSFPIEQGARQISYFAKACLVHVADYYFTVLSNRFGVPCVVNEAKDSDNYEPILWSILCMGKLGGYELNFSSDIDIILCYDDTGEPLSEEDKSIDKENLGCRISVERFYQHFAKSLINALNQPNQIGVVFRVDMRLRPFGNSGAMVCSYHFLQNYLQNHARDWERLAYAKASILSPNTEIKNKFTGLIQPYVYRQYTDYGVLQSIREMRDKITSTIKNQQYENDIKVGFGGIRLLEFSLQSIQFTLYVKYPELKIRGAFNFLQTLKKCQAISLDDSNTFYQNLIFLRRLEHRLQIWQDRQTHLLPDEKDSIQWQWLADTMQFNSIAELKENIHATRNSVHQVFAKILPDYPLKDYELFDNDKEYDEILLTQWLEQTVKSQPSDRLFGNFIICLQQLLNSRGWRQASTQAQDRFSQLLPTLVHIIASDAKQNNTTTALSNSLSGGNDDVATDWADLFRLLSAILQRSAYMSLLCEYPKINNQVLAWCQQQPWLIQQVIDYPMLLESMISPHNWAIEIQRNHLKTQWQSLVNNPKISYERKVNQLRELKRAAVFKVAELNQSGSLDTYKVSDYLTNIARQIVMAALQIAITELRPQWHEKIDIDCNNLPILFIGYGKLGSFELGYSSDLDMVVLYDDTHPNATDHLPFLLRLVRKTTDVLNLYTITGKCYDVDYRLRPDGDKSLLITGINQYKDYLTNRAWMWEKQSLIKARAVVGHRHLCEKFVQIRKQTLSVIEDEKELQQKITDMREKMRYSLDKSNPTQFHLKQGLGGMIDIEFLTQYWAIKLIPNHPQLLRSRSVSSLLSNLSQYTECSVNTQEMIDVYLHYRALVHQLALNKQNSMIDNTLLKNERQKVITEWQKTFKNS